MNGLPFIQRQMKKGPLRGPFFIWPGRRRSDVGDRVHMAARRRSRTATLIDGRELHRDVHSLGPIKNVNGWAPALERLFAGDPRLEDLKITPSYAGTFGGACHVASVFFEHTFDVTALELRHYFLPRFSKR